MFNLTQNPRGYNTSNIVELSARMFHGWLVTSVLAFIKGKRDKCNLAPVIRSIFEAEKKYNFGSKTLTGAEVILAAENWQQKHDGETFPIVTEGRHRAIAYFLASILLGATDTYESIEVSEDVAARITLEGNAANDFVTRLANKEKLTEVIGLISSGVYKKEADLPFKRGTAQKLWAQAELVVVHGIGLEDALKVDKEAARKAGKSMDPKAAIEAAIADKAGNAKKVLSGTKIRELLAMAKTADPDSNNPVTALLNAICESLEMDAKVIVQKAVGAVQAAPAEAAPAPAKGKKK